MNLVSEVKLTYKCKIAKLNRPKITCSESAYKVFLNSWDKDTLELKEEFKILLLNRANEVTGLYTCSSGGVSGTIVDSKLIFTAALLGHASSIILGHNHPSGNYLPSQTDISLTKKLIEGGKLLDISVLDHLIITAETYLSMADNGDI